MPKLHSMEKEESLKKLLFDKDLVCLHIFATWAPECDELASVLEVIADEYKDVVFANVEAENIEQFCLSNQVQSVPSVLFYKFGDLYSRVEGFDVLQIKAECRKLCNFVGLRPMTNMSGASSQSNGAVINGGSAGDRPQSHKTLQDYLSKLTNKAPMMIFIKGSPSEPKCGFSKQLIQILSEYKNIKYEYYDILQNEKVRQGLKTFSNWQTYPQVYVNGDLIGGIDIVKELHECGELEETLPKNEQIPVEERIKKLLSDNKLILFMKGNRHEPKCKFSRALMEMFKQLPDDIMYETFDILEDEEIRQGLKEYSNWPTYPQLYVNSELIGGLDILKELHENNELIDTMRPI